MLIKGDTRTTSLAACLVVTPDYHLTKADTAKHIEHQLVATA